MNLTSTYLPAMREQAPKMFMELRRAGKLDEFLHQREVEAAEMLKGLLANKPKNKWGNYSLADEREAEEIVRAQLIEFPIQEMDQRPEPPEGLPIKRNENFPQPPAQQRREATVRETADVADCWSCPTHRAVRSALRGH